MGNSIQLKVSSGEKDGSFSIETRIQTVEFDGNVTFALSKAEPKGGFEQPFFLTGGITTQLKVTAGVPKLVGTYSPYKQDNKTGNVVRLVFLTIRPEK